jgi:hypothetical protein
MGRATLLRDRRHWHPVEEGRERFWYCGADGAARLVIASEADGFLMYKAEGNQSWVIPRIESVQKWLAVGCGVGRASG